MGKAEKIIKDRLNELKSKLSQGTSEKLDKKLNQMRIYALNISIQELEWLIEKIRRGAYKQNYEKFKSRTIV